MSERGREGHPSGREVSGVCPRVPEWVERPIWSAGRGRKPTCRLRRGRKDYPDVREAHMEVWEGPKAHTEVREGSGGPS